MNNLFGWEMSQTLPVYNFEWIIDTSQFHKEFIKSYDEEIDEGDFLDVNIQYLEKLHKIHNDLLFFFLKE